MGLLEVPEPTAQDRVQIGDHLFEAEAAICLGPYLVFQLVHALLAHEAIASFEPVSQERKAFPGFPTIADLRLGGLLRQAVGFHPGHHEVESRVEDRLLIECA